MFTSDKFVFTKDFFSEPKSMQSLSKTPPKKEFIEDPSAR